MHLITENQSNMNEELILFDSVFCPMLKLNSNTFVEKWKLIPKNYEYKFSLGKFFSVRESSIIKRLQANNIMVSSFKTSGNVTFLYLCCTTRDNTVILMELQMVNCDSITGNFKYKSERCSKELELELFLSMILCENQEEEDIEVVCR